MHFHPGRNRNTHCAANTTGDDRGYRIFCGAGINCGVTLRIGDSVIIDISFGRVLYIANAKGSTDTSGTASANPTGNLNMFRKSISADIKITATGYRAINIGFCCVYNHTDCRSPRYASR